MIRVYSNCDEVELFLNGRSLGKHAPETTDNLVAEWKTYGFGTDRQAIQDGARLRHGPFGIVAMVADKVLDAVWGMAAINVQTREKAGKIVVTSSSPCLKDGRCIVASARE